MKASTTEEFITKAKQIHGDKYDYSKVEYVNSRTKVCIICPEHGEFWQTPNNHLKGYGCLKCSGKEKNSTIDFIEKARKIHGDKYDYSKVEYANNSTDVCIICPIHGEFWQTPNNHLAGRGCLKCYEDLRTKDLQSFIEEARKVHGDKYDYSKVEYLNSYTKVCIICPEHGEFWQTPNGHLQNHGCPICRSSKGEKKIADILNQYHIEFEQQKKFDTCKNKKTLPFDFYLPEYNLCIEFQGRQHFLEIDFFGGQERLKQQQLNDSIKQQWCSKEENPSLLVLDENSDIAKTIQEEILDKKLKKS